jgi:hypothetical chaperone protein
MPLLGFGTRMKRADLNVPSSYFHDLASWHSINRVYDPRVVREVRQVRRDAARPELLDNLVQVIEERRGHSLAGSVEDAKIDLASEARAESRSSGWAKDTGVTLSRDDLASNTAHLAENIASRIGRLLQLASLGADDIDALFLTGGSTRLAHLRSAIAAALPQAKVIEGDTFGSVGIGLAIEAGRRFGPGR